MGGLQCGNNSKHRNSRLGCGIVSNVLSDLRSIEGEGAVKITLKNEVKLYRTQENITQQKLAELAGITRKSVNAIEANRMVPSVILAIMISNALKVSVEKLFTLETVND